jgi:hypothetical protein
MPQIWMTYAELATLIECDPNEARNRAIEQMLDRKKSRDGHTRVRLNLPLTSLFIALACDEVLRTTNSQPSHRRREIEFKPSQVDWC